MEDFDLAVIVDDDPDIALAARLALRDLFKEIATLPSPEDLPKFVRSRAPDAILLDLNFERAATDGSEGLDYLGRVMQADPEAAVVIITAHSAVSVAVASGHFTTEELAASGADHVLSSLEEEMPL